MNIELIPIFPVPVFRSNYFLDKLSQDKLLEVIDDKENKNSKTEFYVQGSYTDYAGGGKSILDYDFLYDFKNFLIGTVQTIHTDLDLAGEVELCENWFTVTRKNGYHEVHKHGSSTWSGVYYVKASRDDAPIVFVNESHFNSSWPTNTSKTILNDFNSNQKICSVETGLLLIFPGFLLHKVERQDRDSDRITIAFNFNIKKEKQ
jgi:uncharacterized protein (TIGR02466 family)